MLTLVVMGGKKRPQGSQGRMSQLSIKHKSCQITKHWCLKISECVRQSAREAELHRQTVIYRSVSLSLSLTLDSFTLIAGWYERVGPTFSRQFTLSIKDIMAANVFRLERHFLLLKRMFNLLECK